MRAVVYLAGIAGWLFTLCHSYGILTKNMIRTPPELKRYEPVTLYIKDNVTNRIVTDIPEEITTWNAKEQDNTDEENEDDEGDEDVEDEDEEEEEEDEEEDEKEEEEDQQTEMPRILSTETTGRTRLYPVGTLWDKTSPDIWTILSAAVNCLWNGLGMDCFKFRVMPMVKSMMGYQPIYEEYQPPYFITSREDTVKTDVVEGRRRRHHLLSILKVLKGALASAIGFKALLVPVLAALAIVAGKSIMFSFASVLLSAVAAWSGIKYAADRRIQAGLPESSHNQYYMM